MGEFKMDPTKIEEYQRLVEFAERLEGSHITRIEWVQTGSGDSVDNAYFDAFNGEETITPGKELSDCIDEFCSGVADRFDGGWWNNGGGYVNVDIRLTPKLHMEAALYEYPEPEAELTSSHEVEVPEGFQVIYDSAKREDD